MGVRAASAPGLVGMGLDALEDPGSTRPSSPTIDHSQVKGMLERMLPARKDSGSGYSTAAPPSAALSPATTPSPSETPRYPVSPGVPASPRDFSGELSPIATSVNEGVGGNGELLHNCGARGKFQNEVLERFRGKLLQRFLSLHDAFSRLDHEASRTKALTKSEFHDVLQRLNVGAEDSDDIFNAMDTRSDGGVTLSEFLHALVDVSPEALLWELRCRLLRMNIGPHNLHNALELVRWPQHGWLSRATKVKRRCTRKSSACGTCGKEVATCGCHPPADGSAALGLDTTLAASPALAFLAVNATPDSVAKLLYPWLEDGSEEEKRKKPTRYHLTRGDWLKFSTSLYLTLLEAERLFNRLADNKRFVDLRAMFETLRTTVEPDVTLERFVVKACGRYENLKGAFGAFCEDRSYLPNCPEPLLWWDGFHKLAIALQVNDSNAAKLWKVLTGSVEARVDSLNVGLLGSGEEGTDGAEGVTLAAFERELSTWAPDTALGSLKENLCNRFGSLAEGQRALRKRLSRTDVLSPRELESRLRAAGIKNCDVTRALNTIQVGQVHVSLDTAIDLMRAMKSNETKTPSDLGKMCHSAVRNQTQQLWDQLRSVQGDCLRRYDDGLEIGSAAAAMDMAAAQQQQSLLKLSSAEKKSKFAESIRGAVRAAETSRSKFVLQQAERQVMNLEKRWASSTTNSGVASECKAGQAAVLHARRPSSQQSLARNRSAPGGRRPSSGLAR